MPIFETFFRRQQRARGELPDVYVYDDIPDTLRVQVVQIMMDCLGGINKYNDIYGVADKVRAAYESIVTTLRRELGVLKLPHSNINSENYLEEIMQYILFEDDVEHVLSAIEIVCRGINAFSSEDSYLNKHNAKKGAEEAIEEINQRFKLHGIGYEYDVEIIKIDAEYVHSEVVKPALGLLRQAAFSGAEQEFRSAHSHYRKGKNKEALNDALKAFESTLKSIFDKRGWSYEKTSPASKLIKVAFDNGLIPSFWENYFSGLRTTLEAGVPTARNKTSGHGQGAAPTTVPNHMAAYVLHMTASAIVFLVKSEEALS